jgi:hypothetical protein
MERESALEEKTTSKIDAERVMFGALFALREMSANQVRIPSAGAPADSSEQPAPPPPISTEAVRSTFTARDQSIEKTNSAQK